MTKSVFKFGLFFILSALISRTAFSQIENVYAALLLKPGHIYLSSDQIKLSRETPKILKSVSLEKNTHYAFSVWAEEKYRNTISMRLIQFNDSTVACLNPAYETEKYVRYFYFTPKEEGLYYIEIELHDLSLTDDVYVIHGVFFTAPEAKEKQTDKLFTSPYCKTE